MLVYSSPHCEGHPAIAGRGPHQPDDLVVGRVQNLLAVDGDDLVAGEQPAVDVGGTARNYVTDGYLRNEVNN